MYGEERYYVSKRIRGITRYLIDSIGLAESEEEIIHVIDAAIEMLQSVRDKISD